MEKIFEYLPNVIIALWGLFTGILLEKVKANKEKRMDIFRMRKKIFIEMTKLLADFPSPNCDIEEYKAYYNNFIDYRDENVSELLLILNEKEAEIFYYFIKLLDTYNEKNEWNYKNWEEVSYLGEELIYRMRKKLLSFD